MGILEGRTILQVIPRLDIGGAETTTLEVTSAITAAGARAIIVSEGGRLVSDIEAAGGEVVPMPVKSKNPFTMHANIGRLAALIAQARVDIVHARSRAPAWSAYYAARRTLIPYLATYHARVSEGPRLKVFYNGVFTRGRVVIANSQFTADAIHRIHKTPREKIRVIPRGCDPDALARDAVAATDVAEMRARWGVPADAFVIICPARLTAWKGQAVLLAALARSRANVRPFLVLAGDAQGRAAYVAALKAQAAAAGLDARLVFAGLVSDMQTAYAASNMAIVPSVEAEPFGRTCIEAQAASLPVIASDAGGFRETIRPGETGWLVPPSDPSALAAAIDNALNMSPETLFAIGAAGRAHVSAAFTTDALRAKTCAVYAELLAADALG